MSVLDLQGMATQAPQTDGGGSHSSTNSCPSDFSVTLCEPHSGLSLLLC
jgi:hypothetical protein